jgi:hypothetical protein
VKNVLLIPEKVPVPSVPSLSIVRSTLPLSSSSNKKESNDDYDSYRGSEKNNNRSTKSINSNNSSKSNGKYNDNNSNDKYDINNNIDNNNNNKYNNIDNNNNSIKSITSNPKTNYPIPSIPPIQPSSSPFHDTKQSTKLSSHYDLNNPIPPTLLPSSSPFYESKQIPSTSTSLSQFFDSKDSRSSNEFSSGDVSRSSSGIMYGNWTEVLDSPGINLNLNLKKNNSYENNSDFGYENNSEKSDEKLHGEGKERNMVSVKKNGEGRGGGEGGQRVSEKKESESEKTKERESGKEREGVREEKKEEMSVDNWMETSIDKNHYEKRNKENLYNYLNKIKSNEKEKEKGNSGKYGNSSITGNINRVCDIIPKQVVLYYCSVLIAGMPGMIYITQTLLCFSSLTTKECFFLNNLNRVKIIEKNEKKDKKTPNLFSSLLSLPPSSSRYPILFSFFSGTREITVLPLTISSDQLQSVIIEVKNSFHSSYFTE